MLWKYFILGTLSAYCLFLEPDRLYSRSSLLWAVRDSYNLAAGAQTISMKRLFKKLFVTRNFTLRRNSLLLIFPKVCCANGSNKIYPLECFLLVFSSLLRKFIFSAAYFLWRKFFLFLSIYSSWKFPVLGKVIIKKIYRWRKLFSEKFDVWEDLLLLESRCQESLFSRNFVALGNLSLEEV